ncbi:MAG: hypothetical protein IRZ16_19380 [Myxococcaceae bacterium]|nr:hypothetical protein [Myxococcaceae bacterium]
MRRAAIVVLLLGLALPYPGRAEITREAPRVEDTGYTLQKGHWKIGIRTSSYGITDRLQVDSALLLDFVVLNVGLKYRLVDAPNLSVSATAWGGFAPIVLLLRGNLMGGTLGLDASMPVAERVAIHLSANWNVWAFSSFNPELTIGNARSGRFSWFGLRATGEYVFQPRHAFFLMVGTPTSWVLGIGDTAHDFDALTSAEVMAGYQYSPGGFNVRVDLGVGPSLLTGIGPRLGVDFYYRF